MQAHSNKISPLLTKREDYYPNGSIMYPPEEEQKEQDLNNNQSRNKLKIMSQTYTQSVNNMDQSPIMEDYRP